MGREGCPGITQYLSFPLLPLTPLSFSLPFPLTHVHVHTHKHTGLTSQNQIIPVRFEGGGACKEGDGEPGGGVCGLKTQAC